jgi:hypothetical protein
VALEEHLRRFVGLKSDAPLVHPGATGERLRPNNFWVIWESARKRAAPTWMRFHNLRHFAATVIAATGARARELVICGEWKSVAVMVRDEQASEERYAMFAQALNPFTQGGNIVSIAQQPEGERATAAKRRVR